MDRKKTRQIHIGDVLIGGGAPVSVQSMTNTKTQDTDKYALWLMPDVILYALLCLIWTRHRISVT